MKLILLCLTFALASCANPPENSKPFFFIQMADTQFGMETKDRDFDFETKLFEKAIEEANRLKPAYVVVCGDLINKAGDRKQLDEFKRIAAKLDSSIPIHLVAGNHDVENVPTEQSLDFYRKNVAEDYYTFTSGNTLGIVLNSTIIHRPDNVAQEEKAQGLWLENELKQAKLTGYEHIFVYVHHPFFLQSADEEDTYFTIPLKSRLEYLALFEKYGVRAVLAGHYHRNSYGVFNDMEMITTSAVGKQLGGDQSGFRLVRVYPEKISHRYYGLKETPEEIVY